MKKCSLVAKWQSTTTKREASFLNSASCAPSGPLQKKKLTLGRHSWREVHCSGNAVEIIVRLFERMHSRSRQLLARRLPLCVVFLAPPLPGAWACPVRGQIEVLHLGDAVVVHAHLCEEILANGSPLCSLHPIDLLGATANVGKESVEGLD